MNCLLCNYTTDDLDNIEEHYVNYHRINKYNFFFQQLMLNKDALLNIDCIRCQKFIPTKKYMSEHNFLEHYIDGENLDMNNIWESVEKNQELCMILI